MTRRLRPVERRRFAWHFVEAIVVIGAMYGFLLGVML